MRPISVEKLFEMLQENGTKEAFRHKLKEIGNMFPSEASGSIVYPLLYDLMYIEVVLKMEIQLIFNGTERISRIKNIRQISLDHYINLCTCNNKEFETIFGNMMECIYGKTKREDV